MQLFSANDQMAIGGYQELKSRNIRIGADISVIGFDNSPGSVTMVPPLTTVNANTPALGYRAVGKIIQDIKAGEFCSSVLDSHFVKRLSCGCSLHENTEHMPIDNSSTVTDILEYCDDSILGNIKNSFFGTIVLDQINSIWKVYNRNCYFTKGKTISKESDCRQTDDIIVISCHKFLFSNQYCIFIPLFFRCHHSINQRSG